jgi:hypothetical protein
MKRIFGALLLIGVLALTWTLTGCRGGTEQTATQPSAGTGAATTGAALGMEQPAGPFQATLSTETPPKMGETRFVAKVTRNGQPITDATVKVSLSMPSMNMAGPVVTLKPSGSQYEGPANLSMGGAWQAVTTVTAGSDTGTATYQFNAGQ